MNKKALVILLLVILLAGGGYWLYASIYNKGARQDSGGQACTEEAKVCPDGSSVGRTGPNCEFAACPGSDERNDGQDVRSGRDKNTDVSFGEAPCFRVPSNRSDRLRYGNPDIGVTFEYPPAWGCLRLIGTQGPDTILFEPENKAFQKIFYHQPSGTLVFIAVGKEFPLRYGDGVNTQDSVGVIRIGDALARVFYALSEDWARLSGTITRIVFSPKGNFIAVDVSVYEGNGNFLFGIGSGADVLRGYPTIWYSSSESALLWSQDERVLVVRSQQDDFGGRGVDGLFLSDPSNPYILHEVFAFTKDEHVGGSTIENIKIVDELVSFSVKRQYRQATGGSPTSAAVTSNYVYDVRAKTLTER